MPKRTYVELDKGTICMSDLVDMTWRKITGRPPKVKKFKPDMRLKVNKKREVAV